jgi:hypothetical protein
MLTWFRLVETKRFFNEYLQALEENLLRKLVSGNKLWFHHNEAAVREDVSDIVRGQILILEDLMKTEEMLKDSSTKAIDELLKKESK